MIGALFERADKAVLCAKINGRDRLEISAANKHDASMLEVA